MKGQQEMSEEVCRVGLGMVPGIGSVLAKHLFSSFGCAAAIFQSTKGRLIKTPGVGDKLASNIIAFDLQRAAQELEKAKEIDVSLVYYFESDYPARMKRLMDAPYMFYQKGACGLNAQKTVGIVGTRKATTYGKEVVEHIIRGLAALDDIVVISGLAYGIDVHAHKACLKHGVPTVAVMANGIDTVYPAQHKRTAEKMCLENGALITEQSIGCQPDAPKFPERNRIIAAMSDVVIVVEAAASGGALITAEFAKEYGITTYAVPGSVFSLSSEGCNALLGKEVAKAFTHIDLLIQEMEWDAPPDKPSITQAEKEHNMDATTKSVYHALESQPEHIDILSIKTGLGLSKLASILLELEFDGLVKTLPGKRFERSS